jgi:Ca2+-binding EF-hand superfamily protein
MKGTVAIIGAVVLAVIVAAVVIPKMVGGKAASTGAVTTAETTEADRLAAEAEAAEAALAAQRDRRIEDAALARLEKELEEAEPYTGKTDKQRLEEAWEWVNANRDPDNPYNELEATLLSLWATMLDGDEQSAAWLMNASLIEIEMTRALDADGDGIVTDEEMQLFKDSGIADLNSMDHPYIVERLDTDGDGELSQDEREAMVAMIGEKGAFAGVIERARLQQWDTNNDGVLSDGEREDGLASGGNGLKALMDQQMEAMEASGTFDGEGGDARREEMRAAIEAQLADSDNEQMRQVADMLIATDLMTAMRVENMDQQQIQTEMLAEMPQAPDFAAFDADGEPGMSETEQAAMNEAVADYQQQVRDFTADATARYMRAQFDNAASQSDANGDGRMTADEWDARLTMLLAERDQRLFKQSYDFDGDGVVRSEELMTYLDWQKAGSMRADANFDGVVDPRDLEFMMINYQRQEP